MKYTRKSHLRAEHACLILAATWIACNAVEGEYVQPGRPITDNTSKENTPCS